MGLRASVVEGNTSKDESSTQNEKTVETGSADDSGHSDKPTTEERTVSPEVPASQEEELKATLDRLNMKFKHLLYDVDGEERGRFIECPKDVIALLNQVADSQKVKLYPVQSYTPNLVNKLFRTPGLPRKGADGSSFVKFIEGGNQQAVQTQKNLQKHLKQHLVDMKYCYRFEDHQVQYYLSYLSTKTENPQPAHIDFRWDVVTKDGVTERKRKRGAVNGYRYRVPFVAFFPLTEDGMTLEIWKDRKDHRVGEEGELVTIPQGCMLLLRGDAIHAGGYMNGTKGDLRAHLYVYRTGGEQHDPDTSNTYTAEIDGERIVLSNFYKHGPRESANVITPSKEPAPSLDKISKD